MHYQIELVLYKDKQELMKNIAKNLTDIWTFQYRSNQVVKKVITSWHPSNSDLATGTSSQTVW